MNICTKRLSLCNRKELNSIHTFLGNLTLQKNTTRVHKFRKIIYIGFYKEKHIIVGMSAIKKPNKKRIKKISKNSLGYINENHLEYGYIYVNPKYRGQGITEKIYIKLSKKTKNKLYATTKENNTIMQKILSKLGYTRKGLFASNIDGKNIFIYSQ